MLVIFGFGHRTRNENDLRDLVLCRRCNNMVKMKLIKQTNWLSLFFIPVIPYRTEYLKRCPVCHHGSQLHYDEYMNLINKAL